jgi:HK97 family phage portal protein
MWPFDNIREERATITQNASAQELIAFFGVDGRSLPSVTIDTALQVPAVWAAVSFLSRTLAAIPLHLYRNNDGETEKLSGGLATLVHEAPNEETTSFKWRQYFWQQVFTGGRGLTWIERNRTGIGALWNFDPTKTKITRSGGRTSYQFDQKEPYLAKDVIDLPFMLKPDGLAHYGPIASGNKAIQLAIAMNDYGSNFFSGGGVPPLVVSGPMPSGKQAQQRAMADIKSAIETAHESGSQIVNLPPGYELKPIGFDPDKGQMTEARRFQIEEIARLYNLPPVFLQDLTHGTFSNTEQQDLHLVKHVIAQWAQAFEEELNLKLFGQRNGGRFVEHNLDGLMRGDFTSRMQGLATSVQNGLLTPNEARKLDNRPAKDNGDDLLIQGATVPLGSQNMGIPNE